MMRRLRERNEWKFFAVLPKANRALAVAWWIVLVLRGVLPAVFAISMGVLVAVVQRGGSLAGPLALVGAVFVLLQVLAPVHTATGANLGDRTAAWLYDRLTEACVHPPGMGHLEDSKLTSDLTVARDFDLAMTGPPLATSMDFIAGGLVAAARERGLARPQHRRGAQRRARRRLRVPARRRSAGQQGAADVRSGRLDDRPLHRVYLIPTEARCVPNPS